MGVIKYTAIIYLAVTCLAYDLSLLLLQHRGVHSQDLNNSPRVRELDVPPNKLISRGTHGPERLVSLSRSKQPPRSSNTVPPRSSSAPLPHAIQPALTNPRDGLHRLKSAPEGFLPGLPRSSGEFRPITPTKSQNEASRSNPELTVDRTKPGMKQKETRQPTKRPSISPQNLQQKADRNLGKAKSSVRTESTRTGIRDESIGPSSSRSSTTDAKPHDRIALDSGATSSGHTAGRWSSKLMTSTTAVSNAQNQGRMVQYDQWLKETKQAIQRAEAAAAQASKSDKRKEKFQTPEIIETSIKANRFRDNSRQARIRAKGALLEAEELLRTEPASSMKGQTCLSSTDHKVRLACATGAMHAKMEREVAKTAAEAKRWNLSANHVKASAKALTRVRAFDEQNNAFQAQYQAQADNERANALSTSDPRREKADRAAKLSQSYYQHKANFYKSVYDQYRQTHKDFGGSESEDEERIFPGVLQPGPKS